MTFNAHAFDKSSTRALCTCALSCLLAVRSYYCAPDTKGGVAVFVRERRYWSQWM